MSFDSLGHVRARKTIEKKFHNLGLVNPPKNRFFKEKTKKIFKDLNFQIVEFRGLYLNRRPNTWVWAQNCWNFKIPPYT